MATLSLLCLVLVLAPSHVHALLSWSLLPATIQPSAILQTSTPALLSTILQTSKPLLSSSILPVSTPPLLSTILQTSKPLLSSSILPVSTPPLLMSTSTPWYFPTGPAPTTLPPPTLRPVNPDTTWTPTIVCAKTPTGTSMTLKLKSGMSDFSVLVMNAPPTCSADLGEFRSDVTIPESCVTDASVEVALQYTYNKGILGGRNFRHFLFTCNDLGIDGQVKDLVTGSNPQNTTAKDSSSSYADGKFCLLVVGESSLMGTGDLTSATSISWSQEGVYLVIQHQLAPGSSHRTLIPTECKVSSTSHPDQMHFYYGRVGETCSKNHGIMDDWVIKSKRTASNDVTYAQIFPFDFKVGEKVTIACSIHECPYVTAAAFLQGQCQASYAKFAECGGTFSPSLSRFRRALSSSTSTARDVASTNDGQTRVMSASFVVA